MHTLTLDADLPLQPHRRYCGREIQMVTLEMAVMILVFGGAAWTFSPMLDGMRVMQVVVAVCGLAMTLLVARIAMVGVYPRVDCIVVRNVVSAATYSWDEIDHLLDLRLWLTDAARA